MQSPRFDNTYASLPERFFARVAPSPVSAPRLIRLNRALAEALGLDAAWLASEEGLAMASGNAVPEGACAIAMAYAGHQFGGFNPQLGDGRALLLGEVVSPSGERFDLQLKGSGPTPFSRGGDGRSPLGPVMREFIVSEAMAALGIPTSRALTAVASGDLVQREQPLPGGVLVRVARSHLRIGTFEYFAARRDKVALSELVAHALRRHYPESEGADLPALALLRHVAAAQAKLLALWQSVGFIHGVMNTDNMLISGETIDFGPCAFLDTYRPDAVFSFIDRDGRYAYDQQPRIAQWNLACLARALLPLLDVDDASVLRQVQDVIDAFPGRFEQAYLGAMREKLGWTQPEAGDAEEIAALFALMHRHSLDFTLTFRCLAELLGPLPAEAGISVSQLCDVEAELEPWLRGFRERHARQAAEPAERARHMLRRNPAIIARNHRVEAAIQAGLKGDYEPFHALVDALARPYALRPEHAALARPPSASEHITHTFCGT